MSLRTLEDEYNAHLLELDPKQILLRPELRLDIMGRGPHPYHFEIVHTPSADGKSKTKFIHGQPDRDGYIL